MQPRIKQKLAAGGIAGALVLGVGAVAGAAAAGIGPFGGEPKVERSSAGATSATSPDDSVPADETRVDGDRTETRQFLDVPDGDTQTFAAGPAGTVTITRAGNVLSISAVSPNSGWTVAEQEQAADGHEVEVKLVNGGVEVKFDAEIEDGMVRVRVRQRGVAPGATTPSTIDDDDNSGPGSPNSGPGSIDDSNDDDHGSGGHGSDD